MICPHCGKVFTPQAFGQKFCSRACRNLAKDKILPTELPADTAPTVTAMKNDWLTIPDAPNYEINSELVCRNKITGQILTPNTTNATPRYGLYVGDKRIWYTAVTWRRKAVPDSQIEWEPVPSLGNLYEIDRRGRLRVAKTKQPLKCHNGVYRAFIDGQQINVSVTSLKWEMFGIVPQKWARMSLIISKGNRVLHFDNKSRAAEFLATQIFFSVGTIRTYFAKRKTDIEGWHINYLNEQLPHVEDFVNGYCIAKKFQ